jgi:hypothetical protein
VRDPTRFATARNETATSFDLDDFGSFETTLSVVAVLGLVTPADPRQVEREAALIAAAQRAGIVRIVKVPVCRASATSNGAPALVQVDLRSCVRRKSDSRI